MMKLYDDLDGRQQGAAMILQLARTPSNLEAILYNGAACPGGRVVVGRGSPGDLARGRPLSARSVVSPLVRTRALERPVPDGERAQCLGSLPQSLAHVWGGVDVCQRGACAGRHRGRWQRAVPCGCAAVHPLSWCGDCVGCRGVDGRPGPRCERRLQEKHRLGRYRHPDLSLVRARGVRTCGGRSPRISLPPSHSVHVHTAPALTTARPGHG
jgi:hypothetical protein